MVNLKSLPYRLWIQLRAQPSQNSLIVGASGGLYSGTDFKAIGSPTTSGASNNIQFSFSSPMRHNFPTCECKAF